MKAMILKEYGDNAKFQKVELPKPSVKAGNVLVKIAATSVNTVDTKIRQMGKDNLPLSPDLPAVLGMDFAGTIDAVGAGVTDFAVGDEVYGCAGGLLDPQGALAEYILADAKLIAHKPKSLSMREAAALPLVGITAYEGLIRAGVGKGQKVLVQGGAGGVGHVAVQLAKHFGADVYATVGNDEAKALMADYNAIGINYKTTNISEYVTEHTNDEGFDVVFDSVGGANLIGSFEAAALNGQVATTVTMLELDLTLAHLKGLSLHVVFMLIPMMHNVRREEHGVILRKLGDLVDAGKLKPLLDNTQFELTDVGDAHERLTSGQAIGKIVINVN